MLTGSLVAIATPMQEGGALDLTALRKLAARAKAFVVAELNYGQVVHEVERIVCGRAKTILCGHGGGALHDPADILRVVEEVLR